MKLKRLPVIAALVAVVALLAFVLWPRQEPAHIASKSEASTENPACLTARNVTDTYQPEPNRADTLAARRIAGSERAPGYTGPLLRRESAEAFALLQKIDSDGTVALAALLASTPDIDNVINQHLANLVWARSMIGVYYEQGRIGRPDPRQAAAFFQKAIDTKFSDDRGCIHTAPIPDSIRKLYVAVLVYEIPSVENRAKALALLEQGGPKFASDFYLLGRNLLPHYGYEYFTENLDAMAEAYRKQPSDTGNNWLLGEGTNDDAIIALLGRILLGCAAVVVLFVGALGLFRYVRRKQGYQDETSIYRTLFAVYDVLHNIVARFGLVAEGLVGCFLGLTMLFGGYAYGAFGNGVSFMVYVSGATAFFGGLAKLVEAARVSMAPKNTLVHGSARAAAETEAHAAARGAAKAPDLGNSSFSE